MDLLGCLMLCTVLVLIATIFGVIIIAIIAAILISLNVIGLTLTAAMAAVAPYVAAAALSALLTCYGSCFTTPEEDIDADGPDPVVIEPGDIVRTAPIEQELTVKRVVVYTFAIAVSGLLVPVFLGKFKRAGGSEREKNGVK